MGRRFSLVLCLMVSTMSELYAQTALERPTAVAARKLPEGVRCIDNLVYVEAGHPRQQLDLYLPTVMAADQRLPVVLWVHGGGWAAGDKARCPAVWLVTRGYAVAAINYRYSQHATFPAQLHDCKAAIRWLRAHAEEYPIDAKRIGAWGGSAGGHLVAMLGTTNGRPEMEGDLGNNHQSSEVRAVVDWYGPTDFLTVGRKETRTKLLGVDPQLDIEKAKAASPLHQVSRSACPFLIVHGDQDKTVPIAQSVGFAAALRAEGVEVDMVTIEGGGHGGSKFTQPDELDRIAEFFDSHLK